MPKRLLINHHLLMSEEGKEFGVWLRENTSLTPNSIATYLIIVRGFLSRLEGRPLTVEEANLYLRNHDMPCYGRALKLYLQFKGIDFSRFIKYKQKQPKPHELINLDTLLKLIDVLPAEEKMISLFMLNSGCRCHEAFKIKVKDLTPGGRVVLQTKGGKYRVIMLSEEYNRTLQDYIMGRKGLLGEEYIFYHDSKASPYNKVRIFHTEFNAAIKKVLGSTLGTHDFRRHYGVSLYKGSSNNILLVQKAMGHSNINTTMRYVGYAITEEEIRKASQIIHERLSQKAQS